jgi:hypothetical protein
MTGQRARIPRAQRPWPLGVVRVLLVLPQRLSISLSKLASQCLVSSPNRKLEIHMDGNGVYQDLADILSCAL